MTDDPPFGLAYVRPTKGLIGWTEDDSLLVVSAGKGGRWERFVIDQGHGQRTCVRIGWRRYLG